MTLSKEQAYQVQMAKWEGWRRLAKQLPDHHLLAVELLRTRDDQTAAVFTAVRNHEVVQFVVRGDARGRVTDPVRKPDQGGGPPDDCGPHGHGPGHQGYGPGPGGQGPRFTGPETRVAMAMMAVTTEPVDANSIALGEPPPKDPPPPGIIALASVVMPAAFDVGDQLPTT
jgi:hypothetical protein